MEFPVLHDRGLKPEQNHYRLFASLLARFVSIPLLRVIAAEDLEQALRTCHQSLGPKDPNHLAWLLLAKG